MSAGGSVYFGVTEVGLMAKFVAELVRQGVTFETNRPSAGKGWEIVLTGGY